MLKGMAGIQGFILPPGYYNALGVAGQFLGNLGIKFAAVAGFDYSYQIIPWIVLSLIICWFLPNAQEFMSNFRPSLDNFSDESKAPKYKWLRWRPAPPISACAATSGYRWRVKRSRV